ncbi:MAG TPA: glycosyltransferase family 4 protein [Actinomycetota bacterium]|nr:glycosyltransferase family 4 protein [Actinomycetota bacterium]
MSGLTGRLTGGRPRHCMVVHAYYPLTETRVQRQAEALVQAGHDVDVLCLRGPGEAPRERYRGVEVHRLPVRLDKRSLVRQFLSYAKFFTRATIRLSRLHLRHPYRAVQVHNLPDFLVFCAMVPKLRGTPVILDLHDLMPEFFAARFSGGRARAIARVIRWQERLACGFADHVITVSDHWRNALIERGVPSDRCSVVMNVADDRVFRPNGHAPSDASTFRLIYHGTVTERYGLDLAIRAVGRLKDELPGIRLTIRGTGDHRPTLIELRRRLGLEEYVELDDRAVPETELAGVIAAADVAVVPYRNDVFTDGIIPTKLMEYAALRLPCVAARTTAIEAYFGDAMVALFEPGDADDLARCIRELARSPERRAELARRSRRFTDRYNWQRMSGEYVELVRSLAEEPRRIARPSE